MALGPDLLAPITLNTDPRDIEPVKGQPPQAVWEKWIYFRAFYTKNVNIKDPFLNTEEGKKKITLEIIEKFNSDVENSNWAKFENSSPYRGYNNPVTREDIFAIQKYHKKVDPNIVIDGWLGTQTYQCAYPGINFKTFYEQNESFVPPPDKLWPVIWGNQRYVILVKDYPPGKIIPPKPRPFYLTSYDPVKHKIKDFVFVKSPSGGNSMEFFLINNQEWKNLGLPYTTETGANEINKSTEKIQSTQKQFADQTKINNTLSA